MSYVINILKKLSFNEYFPQNQIYLINICKICSHYDREYIQQYHSPNN